MWQRPVKILLVIAGGLMLSLSSVIGAVSTGSQSRVDFRRDIEPILAAHCYKCHGGGKASGQLKLDSRATAMKGGISGAVIVPGAAAKSRLLHRIRGEGGEQRMPLGGNPLTERQIGLIERWIAEGAVWPAGADDQKDLPEHWAFVAPVRPKLPAVRNLARNPIDNFILARIEKAGLKPSPEADKTTLLRRLSLDLTGLPPSLDEIDAFLADSSPDAWKKQIERLLASPQIGRAHV